MKYKISISISEPILLRLKERMRDERTSNKSLFIENAVKEFLKPIKENKDLIL